jgi:hypothetical protein
MKLSHENETFWLFCHHSVITTPLSCYLYLALLALQVCQQADFLPAICRAFISEHKHVQEKILEELQENNLVVTKDCPEPRSLSYGDVHKLPFLAATIKVPKSPYLSSGMERIPMRIECSF